MRSKNGLSQPVHFFFSVVLSLFLILVLVTPSNAWHFKGCIYCDVNQNALIDSEDLPLEGVGVDINSTTFMGTTYTGVDGCYFLGLPDFPDTYLQSLDVTTLPENPIFIDPSSNAYSFTTPEDYLKDWLVDSTSCRQKLGQCWLTAGGVKFSPLTQGSLLAEHGPMHSFGGNVFPSCSPEPGDGGQWNHVAHKMKLHFLGTDIHTVACGNVPGIEPGSESPVTPFNFIEFEGTGWLKGIKGNKADYGLVNFYARAEDRNEPGSSGAKDGEDIDRYFIHVWDPSSGNTLMVLDEDMNADNGLVPVQITGGNLQIHISSCDN